MGQSNFKRFLLLWMGELISAIGGGLTSFGLGVYVFEKTGSAAGMAVVTLLGFLPTLLLSVPAGVLVEVYATSLHYAPCQTDSEGFQVLVVLPKGTNGVKPEQAKVYGGDDKLLWACNKWLIAHPETGEAAEGAFAGLIGENIDIAALL